MRALILALVVFIPLAYAQECDYKAEILMNGTQFQTNDFNWQMKVLKLEGNATNTTARAGIRDSSGNLVKSYKPWTSIHVSRQKTSTQYSPNLNPGTYMLAVQVQTQCNDKNLEDNADTRNFIITDNENDEIQNNPAKNQESTILLSEQPENNTGIAMENQNLQDIKDKIEQNNGTPKESNQTTMAAGQQEYDNIIYSHQEPINDETKNNEKILAYESSSEKSKNLALIMLLAFSVVLNIVLIWKR